MEYVVPAAVLVAVFTAGPLLFPHTFPAQTTVQNLDGTSPGRPGESDRILWALTAVALAALAYAVVAMYGWLS